MKKRAFSTLARILGVESDSSTQVAGYQIDSRNIQPKELFFALPGERTDGHHFLAEVKARGGVGAVVSKGYRGPTFGLELIGIDDVALALQGLARHLLEESPAQIVGVSGSVGKTMTKELIAQLLMGKFRILKSPASCNTKLTLPLTLLNREGNEEWLILEMGMSEAGDLRRLVEIAVPDIAVLTRVALVHAVYFPGGVVEIAKAKAEIFSHPKTKRAIFDHGFHVFDDLVEEIRAEKVSFSLDNRTADYFLFPAEGKYAVDERGVRAHSFALPFSQDHILHNLLAAFAVARSVKMEWEEIERRLPYLQLPKMRFEQFERGGISFINDAYNANPESMRAALTHLPLPKEGGKRIAVLGAMKELGAFSAQAHREVGREALKNVDHLLVLGEEAAPLCEAFLEAKRPAELFMEKSSLIERLKKLMREGDVVLVKGSRSLEMERILDQL